MAPRHHDREPRATSRGSEAGTAGNEPFSTGRTFGLARLGADFSQLCLEESQLPRQAGPDVGVDDAEILDDQT
jgi:hypothetical protein